MSAGDYSQFLSALGQYESGNNYAHVSSLGYLGRFQFGEGALKDIGFYAGDGTLARDFIGAWTSKAAAYGVTSKATFLASPAGQDAAGRAWFAEVWKDLASLDLDAYVGTTTGGIPITISGLVAGGHLVGVWNVKKFLDSGGATIIRDGYGTPVTTYISRFGGYDTPFDAAAAPSEPTPIPAPTGGRLLTGTAATDYLAGAEGADTISGGWGADVLRGQNGADRLDGGAQADRLDGGGGDDLLRAGLGDDRLLGGWGRDSLLGQDGADVLLGEGGADTLDGGGGRDEVRGGDGDDRLIGGGDADILAGDGGHDVLSGGRGADTFRLGANAGTDRVTDFRYAEGDRVNVLDDARFWIGQAGADTVITIEDGSRMILMGVQTSSLPSGWIF